MPIERREPWQFRARDNQVNAAINSQLLIPSRVAADGPFFVVGAQRSGTTMLRLMLNAHPGLSIPFESGFIVHFFRRLNQYGDLSRIENARRLLVDISNHWRLSERGSWIKDHAAILAEPIRSYADLVHAIFRVHARAEGKSVWGDKTPGQETSLDVLSNLFPGCRIIHLVRDGRDVAQSSARVSWGFRSLPRAASDWRWKVTLGHKLGAMLGPYYREFKYETLVLQPESTLREICGFLGVQYDPAMLTYHETAQRYIPEASLAWHNNSIKAPDLTLVYAWKSRMSRADRIIFEQVAGDALDLMGYERERLASTLRSRFRNLYYANLCRW
jgi:sulfotransferase family protein